MPVQALSASARHSYPPQNACRARGPARRAATRIGRGRRSPRAVAELAATRPKLPAGLACPGRAGGRRLPPCALGGEGAAHWQLPSSISSTTTPRVSPPPHPATGFRAAVHRALRGRHLHALGPPGRPDFVFLTQHSSQPVGSAANAGGLWFRRVLFQPWASMRHLGWRGIVHRSP